MTALRLTRIAALAAFGWVSIPAQAASSAVEIVERLASGAVAVPEPGQFSLFVLGVAGVFVGRYASRTRKPREDSELDG